ncbi:hypothetical protein [Variovorax sp. W6]|uniref:hypothetical protein n=1 Tax=Variovorax sp. W6 TaxID=3093895 RepID=UPI003D80933C
MHPRIEHIVQTESGPRNVLQGMYRGTKIEVVSGYDIAQDGWPFHVYMTPASGQRARLFEPPSPYRSDTLSAAFDEGMAMAVQRLDRDVRGFQTKVR